MTENEIKQLLDLAEKRNTKDYEWTKNVILMASGLLGILVSLHNNKSPSIPTHYFFCITILTLGLGILTGTIFLYEEASTLHKLLNIKRSKAQSIGGVKVVTTEPYGLYNIMR